ncbi:MAG TPA: xanthine dehydrogenase family protein molybdopterin-binding subunit [Rhodospirillales bacterium]|jgi:carbon-monoxide dehydrogenase large subunit|nr:xanthine dehydrogenase family protein molybdopterin-binding subunit [Rhodospirillales bacterium]HIL77094.1 xanthine dehydrogenase family protein molybdopterin-binding subunit [Rhodospirillales bacterium]
MPELKSMIKDHILDRPNSYIGRSVPRPNAKRLLAGRGTFTDDINLPRQTHVAFLRSTYAHAEIVSIDVSAAKESPGVVAVVTGIEMAKICSPWVGVLSHLEGLKSAPQHALAVKKASWQGEPVVAIVANSRAQAEDAIELIDIEWKELPAVTDMETALDENTPLIHPELGDNLSWQRDFDGGDVDAAFAKADNVIEETYISNRHTGVCLEARGIVADYNPGEDELTIYHSTQTPHMMQSLFAKHLDIEEHKVRVICKDVGGSYGIKVHSYPDEYATVALAYMLKRPVKFTADRLESFTTDIHARDHIIKTKVAVSNQGEIQAFEIDDLTGIGPYSVYPRTSGIEANQVVNLTGGQYTNLNYRARARVVLQNKTPMCQYRAVGHPILTMITEGMVDDAARKIGMDPVEIRRKNLIPDDAYPCKSPTGLPFENLSHHESLEKLVKMLDYDALRKDQSKARKKGIYRGIGVATFIEVTNPGPAFYGVGGASISAQDGATMRLDAKGNVIIETGVTEQGQGAEAVVAQCAASALGVTMDKIKVITGDTDITPYGGGTWGSRAAGIGGEAAVQAGKALRDNIVEVASIMLQCDPSTLDIRDNNIVDVSDGNERMPLSEIGRVCYYRPDTLPKDYQSELVVTRHYVPKKFPFAFTNGVQGCYLEVDINTGFIKFKKYAVVEDCGTVINPMLVDEQVRGGVIQGLGGALYEECLYSPEGQFLNGTMADYLVPMAVEMPDIEVGHVESPTLDSELGAKGAGEAGTGGAPATVMNAINDALYPLGGKVTAQPFTPERILAAIGAI